MLNEIYLSKYIKIYKDKNKIGAKGSMILAKLNMPMLKNLIISIFNNN
jgi:hypothetical protein